MKQLYSKIPGLLLTLAVGLMTTSSAFGAANIVIQNIDAAGVGFNDPTAVAPVGGNNGTTLGQQRLNAFTFAAGIWGATLTSGPTITIRASWASLPCSTSSGTLGSAGATDIRTNFAGAPFANTWYSAALANAISNSDLNGSAEISAQFNSNLGTSGCLPSLHWYYGLDTNSGPGGVNLVTVLLHEFGHGLGFQTFTDSETGAQPLGFPSIYDRFLLDNSTGKTWPQMTNAERVASSINTSNLVWNGSQVTGASSVLTAGKDSAGHPRMYAPNPLSEGSSVSHWDTTATPNQLMEPNISSGLSHSVTSPDLTFSLMQDIGWCAGCSPPPTPSPTPSPSPPANNNFAAAQIISGCSGSVNGTNQGANKEAGELSHSPDGDAGGSSVWYQWQAPSTGSVTITTAGSNYDTLLAVYTGTSVSALNAIVKNDDVDPGNIRTSTVTFNATSGTVYKIAVDGWGGDIGNIVLNWSLSGCKTDQTINFTAPSDKTFGDAPFAVSATATSGLSVSFSIFSGPATISTNTVTITGVGAVTVRASQAGNASFNPAPNVDRTFNVAKANQTITFNALTDKTFGDAPFNVVATASSGLAVSFSIVTGPATISVNTVTITGGGVVTVRASQAGNASFNPAPNVDRTFNVAKANQTITFNVLTDKTFGDAPFNVVATASSGLAVSFSIVTGPATISVNTVTITGGGVVTVRASQAGNASFNPAPNVDRTFNVAKANQTITFNVLTDKTFGDAPFNVVATASSGLAVSFSIVSGPATISVNTVTITGGGVVTVRASQAGNANFNAAPSIDRSFTVEEGSFQGVVLTVDQGEIKTWTIGGRTYAYVKLLFPNAGYRVANWGLPAAAGNDFSVDAAVEKFTGASVQAVTTTAQIYDLGPLADGNYTFAFKNSGTAVKSHAFTVSSAIPLLNMIDDAREFVKQQYRDFLNREADQAGEDFWTNNITKCLDPAQLPPGQTEAQCIVRQRETTSGAFFLSPEFQYTGYYVYRMYQGALGRQPKLSEFTPDAQFVGAAIIVNSQLSGAKINQNKADYAQQFVNCTDAAKYRCAEFKAIYDGLSNEQYVDRLFLTTGVSASANDRLALVNGLNGGTETRASVLQKVVDGINVISEGNQQFTTTYGLAFYNSEFNRAFVQLEYFGYMKRDPDEAGNAFWLGKLNQFGGNFVNAEMVLAFISSPEYRARFGQP